MVTQQVMTRLLRSKRPVSGRSDIAQHFRTTCSNDYALVTSLLYERGLRTAQGLERWNLASIRGLLTNPAYMGRVYGNRWRKIRALATAPGVWRSQCGVPASGLRLSVQAIAPPEESSGALRLNSAPVEDCLQHYGFDELLTNKNNQLQFSGTTGLRGGVQGRPAEPVVAGLHAFVVTVR